MGPQVEPLDHGSGHLPGARLGAPARQREHRAVVVGIRVDVEQRITGGRSDRRDDVHPQALRDVDDAFEHQ